MVDLDGLYNMTLSSDKFGLQVFSSFYLYLPFQLFRSCKIGADITFQVSIHAIGDRANDLILDMYASLPSEKQIRDRRYRVYLIALKSRDSSIK